MADAAARRRGLGGVQRGGCTVCGPGGGGRGGAGPGARPPEHRPPSSRPRRKSNPEIKACKASDNWTAITFKPDLAKFDMEVGSVGGR
jgi:hypothetical protein